MRKRKQPIESLDSLCAQIVSHTDGVAVVKAILETVSDRKAMQKHVARKAMQSVDNQNKKRYGHD